MSGNLTFHSLTTSVKSCIMVLTNCKKLAEVKFDHFSPVVKRRPNALRHVCQNARNILGFACIRGDEHGLRDVYWGWADYPRFVPSFRYVF